MRAAMLLLTLAGVVILLLLYRMLQLRHRCVAQKHGDLSVEIYKIANVLWFLKHAGFHHSSGDLLANTNHCLLNGSAVN